MIMTIFGAEVHVPWYKRVEAALQRKISWYIQTRKARLVQKLGGYTPNQIRFLMYRSKLLAFKYHEDPFSKEVLASIMRLDPDYAEISNIIGHYRALRILRKEPIRLPAGEFNIPSV